MKLGTKDQIEGKLHEVKGTLQEKAGQITNNPDVAAKGQAEKLSGKIQGKIGQIEKVFEKLKGRARRNARFRNSPA